MWEKHPYPSSHSDESNLFAPALQTVDYFIVILYLYIILIYHNVEILEYQISQRVLII